MTKNEMAKKLGELKAKASDLGKFLIDEVCDLINRLPDRNLRKIEKTFDLIDNYLYRDSRIDDVNDYLTSLHIETKRQLFEAQKHAKDEALSLMRKEKKKRAVWVIVFLGILTGFVLALGILSVLELIPVVWCNVIGVCDCVFGLIFFIYEYCDDKLNEASISAGNAETIKKYYKGSGDIINPGESSVNITGKVKGNITVIDEVIDELFK